LSTEYKWEIRKRNTGRLSVLYQQKDGTPISLAGCTATLFIYSGDAEILEKDCAILGPNQIDLFLTEAEIIALEFEQGGYEVIVEFGNGDKETFVEGALVVRNGRGPFE
jgi:hypothetical protein